MTHRPHTFVFFRRLCFGLAVAALAGAMAFGRPVYAKETTADSLTVQASLGQKAAWSSNPLMSLDHAKPLWQSTTSPEVVFRKETGVSQLDLSVRVDENVANRSEYNSSDVHSVIGVATHTERWNAGLQTRVDYDTTRTSELTSYDFQSILSRHLGLTFSPQISYNFSPLDTLGISGSVFRSQYDKKDYFTNYDTYSANASYSRQLDPRNAALLSLQAQRYQTTRNNLNRVDSFGPSLGWRTSLTPEIKADFSAGAQASRQYTYGVAVTDWDWQSVFSGGLTFEGEQDDFKVSASRSLFPQGNGTQAMQTAFSVKEDHNLSPLVSMNVGGGYRVSHYQTTSTGNMESLADAGFGAAYHATEDLDLTLDYKYRYETLINRTKTVQDNRVAVGLVYRPDVNALFR